MQLSWHSHTTAGKNILPHCGRHLLRVAWILHHVALLASLCWPHSLHLWPWLLPGSNGSFEMFYICIAELLLGLYIALVWSHSLMAQDAKELCASNRVMCPLCDSCDNWVLNTVCVPYRVSRPPSSWHIIVIIISIIDIIIIIIYLHIYVFTYLCVC